MLNKKGAEPAGFLGFVGFGGISILIMIGTILTTTTIMEERAKSSVIESITAFNENLFLFNYLRHPIDEKAMADIVINDFIQGRYEQLERETTEFLNKLYAQEDMVCYWRIYINDELIIDDTRTLCNEKTIHETYIPNHYGLEPIKFKFVFY